MQNFQDLTQGLPMDKIMQLANSPQGQAIFTQLQQSNPQALQSAMQDAQAVLFGHTHSPLCEMIDGMWVLNPGSCGHGCGTVGLIEVENGEILNCRILRIEDLEGQL